MSFQINTNIQAANAYRNLQTTSATQSKALERLSSGLRINRAGDDAAGLVLSENLRSLSSGINVAVRNAQDGIGVVQTAEGALTEVHSILQRMRDLAVGAANSGAMDGSAKQASQDEVNALTTELDRIANTTQFGSTKLLNGTYGVQAGKAGGYDAASTFTLSSESITVDVNGGGGNLTVNLTNGTYTGKELAAEVESQVNAALAGSSNAVDQASAGTIKVSATAVGDGWSFEIKNMGGADVDFKASSGGIFDGMDSPVFDNSAFTTVTAATQSATGSNGVFQVGAENSTSDLIGVSISDMRVTGGTTSELSDLVNVDLTAANGGRDAITLIDRAISKVSSERGSLGATQNRFEHTISNLRVTQENLQASESRIRDADMAVEMVSFSRSQILTQAGTAMLAQANQAPSAVLSLLQ